MQKDIPAKKEEPRKELEQIYDDFVSALIGNDDHKDRPPIKHEALPALKKAFMLGSVGMEKEMLQAIAAKEEEYRLKLKVEKGYKGTITPYKTYERLLTSAKISSAKIPDPKKNSAKKIKKR